MDDDRFVYEKLGELQVDDSEATGPLLIDEADLDEKPVPGPKRRDVHIHVEE